jgi:hypothetical protein
MSPTFLTVILLIFSNVFMMFAWYGHLKLQQTGFSAGWPLWAVIIFSWLIALVEYCFMIPANRIGYDKNGGPFSLLELKVMQEAITLVVFVIFTFFVFGDEPLRWNHFAAFVLLIAAVYLAFLK